MLWKHLSEYGIRYAAYRMPPSNDDNTRPILWTILYGPYIWKRPCILYSRISRPYDLVSYLAEESPRHPNESSKIILTCFYSQILILLHIFHIISIDFCVSFLTLSIRRVSDFQFLYAQSVPYWITISLFLQFFQKVFFLSMELSIFDK